MSQLLLYQRVRLCANLLWFDLAHRQAPAHPGNIRLLLPPASSPNLNPAEHIWEDLHEKILSNMTFTSVGRLIHRLCVGIKHLAVDPERVRSMTDFQYLRHPF